MRIYFTLAILLICLPLSLLAQDDNYPKSRYGIRCGFGASTITGLGTIKRNGFPSKSSYSGAGNYNVSPHFDYGHKIALDLGFTYQRNVPNKYFIQADLTLYDSAGASLDEAWDNEGQKIRNMSLISIRLRTYIGKDKRLSDNAKLLAGMGPYLSWNSGLVYQGSGKIRYGYDEEYDEEYDYVVGDEAPVNAFDVGMSALLGVEISNWQFAFTGDFGLTNLVNDPNFKTKHRAYKVGITYFLF